MSRLTRGLCSISTCTGLSPSIVNLSRLFQFIKQSHWAFPSSLVTTKGISIDFFSSGYLDISVLRVCFLNLCIQLRIPHSGGFPHSEIFGSKLIGNSPKLFAAYYVFLRLLSPRHPPDALCILIVICFEN